MFAYITDVFKPESHALLTFKAKQQEYIKIAINPCSILSAMYIAVNT